MKMTLLTALELAGNYPQDILINAAEQANKKWAAFCYMLRNGEIHKIMLSTEPVFDTEVDAVNSLHDVAKMCKKKYSDFSFFSEQKPDECDASKAAQ